MKKILLLRRFSDAEISSRASALSFHTLLSIVPIIGMLFWLLQSLGITSQWIERLKEYLLAHLNISSGEFFLVKLEELTSSVSGGSWGSVGLIIFLFTAGNIVTRLGNSIDKILGTSELEFEMSKNYWKVLSVRLLVLMCLPLGVLLSLLIAQQLNQYSFVHEFFKARGFDFSLYRYVPWIIDFMGILAVYKFIPRSKIPVKEALKVAFWVTLVYEIANFLFAQYNHYAITTHKLYGAFSAIPMFFLWIYFNWMLLLTGSLFICSNKKCPDLNKGIE